MDIKSLLNDICSGEQYEKPSFDCYPVSPATTWSSASSISSSDTILSSVTIPLQKTRTQQQTRTPWTATEDYLLEKGYLQGLSWAMISAKYLPHRSRGCCWGRFKTLRTKSFQKKRWSMNEDKVLLNSIKKHTSLFKQAWGTLAFDLNNRNWKECNINSTRLLTHYSQDNMPC